MGRVASIEHPSGVEIVLFQGWKLCDATSTVLCFCDAWRYYPIRCDFGPPDLMALRNFIRAVDTEVRGTNAKPQLFYCVYGHPRSMSNAVFLLGGYMILVLGATPEQAMRRFAHLSIADYIDVSGFDFGLRVRDCLDGLYRAKLRGWVGRPYGHWCGRMDMDKYALYGDVLNGDLHEVVPGRIVALRSPLEIKGQEYRDERAHRHFAATYYARIFRRKSVHISAVIQLNPANYDPDALESVGVRHFSIECNDDWPSKAVVADFFRIVDRSPKVAVHCQGGLDRTGTLVALYLMQRYGFSAREAMGWLRVVRPGSVVGLHQRVLCETRRDPPADLTLWCTLAVLVLLALKLFVY